MDREKEREMELESATYTNCLLLGLDPTVIGLGSTTANPRVGLFRHSNPKLGEHLLYFILSSLRGPIQSSKDFDRVWPIFDSAQSRDFRKVVQGIISELESQGALPRSNSRVSSLATCCGPRFVELLWQLSLHALREVHRRSFAIDLASNPLPAPLTDVAFTNAAALLPVTKARIALERRKFLKNAEAVVQRQTMWSNLAHEMTSEFRALCAEEAYLQQELETLHDLRNKVKLEGEHWDELVSSSSQNSCMVQRATYLWDSLLSRKSEHELLSSGPIEDLIAHREHRYRISGSSLLAAMEQSSLSSSTNLNSQHMDNEQTDSSQLDGKNEVDLSHGNEELTSQSDERNARWQASVDIAEVLRRWTHALQRIHKQSLQLAKANNGEAPGLLRSAQDGGAVSHAESLAAAVAEHRQHLDSIQVLINQVKDVAPAIQNSILELTEEVNSASSNLPLVTNLRASSTIEALGAGRVLENGTNDIVEISSRMSSAHIDNELDRIPTLKLPPLFSSTPSSGKSGSMQKQHNLAEIRDIGSNIEKKQPPSNHLDNDPPHDADILSLHELKISVREAALSSLSSNLDLSEDSRSNDSFEHFLVPFCGTGFSQHGQDRKLNSRRTRQSFTSQEDSSLIWMHSKDNGSKHHGVAYMLNDMDSLDEFDSVNGFLSVSGSNLSVSDAQISLYDTDEAPDQVFSPPLLMDASLLVDAYEDLLAPLSETETALMEH